MTGSIGSGPRLRILQPKNNLECGVTILSNQIFVRHRPFAEPADFQAPTVAAFFLAWTFSVDALPACHSHERLVPWLLIWPSLLEVLLVCPQPKGAESILKASSDTAI